MVLPGYGIVRSATAGWIDAVTIASLAVGLLLVVLLVGAADR
jgi:hypothetical protein